VAPKSGGSTDLITGEGTNVFDVCCPRCGSVVLRKNSAKLIERQCISVLKRHRAAGPDDLPPVLFYDDGYWGEWRNVPIFKKGIRGECNDNTSVSLTPVVTRLPASPILRRHTAARESLTDDHRQSIPVYAKKSELSNPSNEFPTDMITQFWAVHDMYTFENVGFTHSVNAIRYLTCADCELGPIGFQDMAECQPAAYYVALSRTCHRGQSAGESQ
ncbi:hypothetical protein T265_14444, partial [Opisthorchis viverrini]